MDRHYDSALFLANLVFSRLNCGIANRCRHLITVNSHLLFDEYFYLCHNGQQWRACTIAVHLHRYDCPNLCDCDVAGVETAVTATILMKKEQLFRVFRNRCATQLSFLLRRQESILVSKMDTRLRGYDTHMNIKK